MSAPAMTRERISTAEIEAVLPPMPRPKNPLRIGELWLLLLALTAGVGALAFVGFAVTGALPANFALEAGALIGLSLLMHIVIRLTAPFADQTILPAVVLLNGVGLAMINRLELAGVSGADGARNTQWTAVSIALASITLFVLRDHRSLRRLTYTAMIAGLALLALPMVPGLGVEINGARIWIHLGPFSLQPGEFAKIAFAIFFAGYLFTNRDNLALAGPKFLRMQFPRLRDLGPIMIAWAASVAVLILQNDLGTSLLIFGMFVAMIYVATERVSWLVIGGVLFAAGAYAATQMFWHVAQRMDIWLNAMDPAVMDRVGGSWQIVAGLFGMANGGLLGTGLGRGFPYLVPLSFSDFIYTSLGEELGLTGMIAIILVFLILVERGFRTAIQVRDGFGKLLASGFAFLIAFQLFVIIGGITRIIPLSGLTIPFMAQGGSSLLSNWIIVALLLRISDNARRPSADPGIAPIAQLRPDADVIVAGRGPDAAPLASPDGPLTEVVQLGDLR